MRSHSHLSRGSNLNSNNSAGSRGGATAHFRLREVLESTPGWDMENMTFLSLDLPWLHMQLKDLNEEINTTNNQAKTEANSNTGDHSEEMDKAVPTSAGGATQVVGQLRHRPRTTESLLPRFHLLRPCPPSMNEGVPSARGGVPDRGLVAQDHTTAVKGAEAAEATAAAAAAMMVVTASKRANMTRIKRVS